MKRVPVLAAVLAWWMGGAILMSRPQTPDGPACSPPSSPSRPAPGSRRPTRSSTPRPIFDYIDGAGEVYRSYNMRRLVARRFHKDGRPDIVVDAFDMGSAADAFGVFTHDLDGEDASIGQGSAYKAGLLSFWKDRYFLSVYAEEETAGDQGPGPRSRPAHRRGHPGDGARGRPCWRSCRRTGSKPAVSASSTRTPSSTIISSSPRPTSCSSARTTDAALALVGGRTPSCLVAAYRTTADAARARDVVRRGLSSGSRGRVPCAPRTAEWTAVRSGGGPCAVVFDAASEREALDRARRRFRPGPRRSARTSEKGGYMPMTKNLHPPGFPEGRGRRPLGRRAVLPRLSGSRPRVASASRRRQGPRRPRPRPGARSAPAALRQPRSSSGCSTTPSGRCSASRDAVKAWKTLIRPDDVVGIKTNVWRYIPTTAEVEQAIKRAGHGRRRRPRTDIGIDDRGRPARTPSSSRPRP
ncbi:MAG: hypothetical protein M0C28_37800 [Candidatus Moduliflexus flocculans]|nr:hypothetical protein [Candidatus Moduliflexus flocculans]